MNHVCVFGGDDVAVADHIVTSPVDIPFQQVDLVLHVPPVVLLSARDTPSTAPSFLAGCTEDSLTLQQRRTEAATNPLLQEDAGTSSDLNLYCGHYWHSTADLSQHRDSAEHIVNEVHVDDCLSKSMIIIA